MYSLFKGVGFKAHGRSEYFRIVLYHFSNNPIKGRLVVVIGFQKRDDMLRNLCNRPEFLFYLVCHGKREIPGLYFSLVKDNFPGIRVVVTQDEGENQGGATQHQECHLECDTIRKP